MHHDMKPKFFYGLCHVTLWRHSMTSYVSQVWWWLVHFQEDLEKTYSLTVDQTFDLCEICHKVANTLSLILRQDLNHSHQIKYEAS